MAAEIGLRRVARGSWRSLAAWLVERLRSKGREQPRLALIERIALAPKQSLALVEAEGHRLLVAFSVEGTPVFHALDDAGRQLREAGNARIGKTAVQRRWRISW